MDLKQVVDDVKMVKTIQVSPDAGAKKAGIHKTITLEVNYSGMTLEGVFLKALDSDVISWANGGSGRKNYDNLIDRSTVEVDAKTPGRAPQIDSAEAEARKLAQLDKAGREAYIQQLLAKADAMS